MRGRAVVLALGLAAGLVVAVGGPAEAARTSTGRTCTITGTAGNDVLRGTSRADVICGLGGDDVIYGRGGDDVIDGGRGHDRIDGGDGADQILGGTGRDRVVGGGGRDRIKGQGGSDTLVGRAGNDAIEGGSGADLIQGGDGNDVTYGGTGDDVLAGLAGSDVLVGGPGDDDLNGGGGADAVNGGDGTNWCTVDPADTSRARCVYDTAAPTVRSVRLATPTVDVTHESAQVDVAIRVVDDTGFVQVQAGLQGVGGGVGGGVTRTIVSGTPRDGWVRLSIVVPRWSEPGELDLWVAVNDRSGKKGDRDFPAVLTVIDRAPDRADPVVRSVGISSSTGRFPVDVRSAERKVTVTARITDDRSGVAPFGARVCLAHPTLDTYNQEGCRTMTLISGTPTDGVFRATVPIEQGAPSGPWSADISVSDRAHPLRPSTWYAPQSVTYLQAQGFDDAAIKRLPAGGGGFTVTGAPADVAPPNLVALRIDKPQIDTLPQAVTVYFDLHLTDDVGVRSVGVFLTAPDSTSLWPEAESLVSGTVKDGVWRVPVVFPQGVPPQTFTLEVLITDAAHSRSWYSASTPQGDPTRVLSPGQTPDGDTVTVVPHAP